MTIFLPLDGPTPLPHTPPFLLEADRSAQLTKVMQAIMKAKRVVIICGAGISVQAGIPDFRSQEGLFKTLKRDNPREALTSGKDLFDASVFNTEQRTAMFCQMMAQLADLSQNAEPTSFHRLLRTLDTRGRLLRVYTQNIDAIEEKCGLSFGVPEFDGNPGKKCRGRPKAKSIPHQKDPQPTTLPTTSTTTDIPRCIPLHGALQQMHCQVCRHSFPLRHYVSSLRAGQLSDCPECTKQETARAEAGKRSRGVGRLRPSVVLYNEAHHNGEGVGDVVQKDLMGTSKKSGADLLLVVGTSLKVPGTKRMVREFSKSVKSRGNSSNSKEESSETSSRPGSSRQSPAPEEDPLNAPMRAVYLNLDFPVPTREWEGVFDAWVQGDAQSFADILQEEISKEAKAKEQAIERKKKREQDAAAAAAVAQVLDTGNDTMDVDIEEDYSSEIPRPSTSQPMPKRKNSALLPSSTPDKRQKIRPAASSATSATAALPTPLTPRTSRPNCNLHRPFPSSHEPLSHLPSPELTPSYPHQDWRSEPYSSPGVLYKEPLRAKLWGNSARSPSFHSSHINISSIRSTLADHERDTARSPSLGHDGPCLRTADPP